MFDALIRFSLRHRLLVLGLAASALVYGVLALRALPVDVLPDLSRPTVAVMVEAPGLSPEEVERLVVRPLELQLSGTPGLERLRSSAGVGLGLLWAEFGWSAEPYRARQLVAERLGTAARSLPEGVEAELGPLVSVMGEVLLVGLTSKDGKTSPMELRDLAERVVRPRLLLPGVAQVTAIGGEVRQLQVQVDPRKLATFDLTLEDVERAARGAQGSTGGGFVERQGRELLVRNLARTLSAEALADTVVAVREGFPVSLRQVASVVEGPKPRRGDAGVDGRSAVILSVQKQPGANTLELTEQLDVALRELAATLPPDVQQVELFRQARFIEAAVENVEEALRDGVLLVVVVLLLFLMNLRTTAITLTAIPLSFALTAGVMSLLGLSINTLTLGGLAIAIGELVDDAIVDVENVYRRLRENRDRPEGERLHPTRVVLRASLEVRSSIVYATLMVMAVFVPLFALTGMEGRLFSALGVAYLLSIVSSLLVSLTVTPVLCAWLLRGRGLRAQADGPLVRWLKRGQTRILGWTLVRTGPIVAGAVALVLLALGALPLFGREFLPTFNEGTLTLSLLTPPGTSLEESARYGRFAEKLVAEVPEVVSVGRRTGRAEGDEHAEAVSSSELDVQLRESGRSREEVVEDVRARLGRLPGVSMAIGQPISHRLDHLLSGVRAQVAFKLYGPELGVLRAKAEALANVARGVEGAVDVQVEPQVRIPQLQVHVDREAARRYGVAPGALVEALEGGLGGRVVGQLLDGNLARELVVRYADAARAEPEALSRLLVDTPRGKVPLDSLARIVEGQGPNAILRENGERRVAVSANVSGRDLSSVVEEIQARVRDEVPFPPGYRWEVSGQYQSQAQGLRQVLLLGLLAFAIVAVVLHGHFGSWRLVAQVLLNIPLALVGSVVAVALSGGVLSMATVVGFITLCGIASRNTLMMISHYLHLVREEGMTFGPELVRRGSLERLVPVLMTASTAALGLIPLALSQGAPGKEILQPVAAVILGGLISSTLLDLLVTPAVFLRYGGPALERALRRKEEDVLAPLAPQGDAA